MIHYNMKYVKPYKDFSLNENRLKWTKEKCQEEALKYKTRTEFQKGSSAYASARKNGWLDEICSHMKPIKRPDGYWTKDKCHEEALKYKTRNEFHKNGKSAYGTARKNGWLDEICSHMKLINKPRGYWTKERCQEEALKYKTRTKFKKGEK